MRARRENAKPSLIRRVLACLVSAAMVVAFTPVVAWGGEGDVSYRYCDENGANWQTGTKSTSEYTEITDSITNWSDGWYVANGDVTIGTAEAPQRVTVSGAVHLILADNCSLTVNGGIQVQDNDNDPSTASTNSLTIYGQTLGTGKLVADAGTTSDNAGIGGDYTSGDGGNGGTVYVYGGTVEAKSNGGAGIGGSYGGSGGEVTISGGTVTATSAGNGAGIGGGFGENAGGTGGNVTISGGIVEATSKCNGAGIGGGYGSVNGGTGGQVTIIGGVVTANGGGAGIGGGRGEGDQGGSGTFSTNGGNAVIFASSISDKTNQGSWSGVIFEGINEGMVYSSPTLCSDLTIPNGTGATASYAKTLTVPNGKTLTIASGKTLTIPQGSTLTNNGTIINKGTITGTVSGNQPVIPTDYRYYDAGSSSWETGNQNCVEITVYLAASSNKTLGEGWYVVNTPSNDSKQISGDITFNGNVRLILADNCKLTVNGSIYGGTASSLTIYGQSGGTGTINVTGSISGGDGASSFPAEGNGGSGGDITINGGEIIVSGNITGGSGGIGSQVGPPNSESQYSGGDGGSVTINGGTVAAADINGGAGGDGYDKANSGAGGDVTINGGTVYYLLTLVDATATRNAGDIYTSEQGKTYGKKGSEIALTPGTAPTGHSFGGWSVTSGSVTVGEDNKFTMPSEAVTVAAYWTANQYSITFETNGGSPVTAITQGYGTTVAAPTDPTKDGYTFAGWYSDEELSQPYTFTTMPVGGITLYAKWLSQDTSVQKVAVKGVEGTVSGTEVEVTLPYNVALPTVGTDFEIVTTSDKAQKTQPVKEGDVWKFVVTAEDGVEKATYTVTVKQQPAPYVPPTYNVPAEGEGGVAVKVTVSGSTAVVAEISASALESAAGSGAATVTIDLSGLPKGVTQAQLSKSTVDKLLAVVNDAGNAVESVTVNLGGAVLTLDAKALAAVAGQAKGANVTLGVAESKADSLNSAQKQALSPFEVVQLYFTAEIKSGGAEIHDFGGGSVRVSVAFEPRPGHNPARYVVLYVGEDGTIERYATAWAAGMLSFTAPHFSAYAVVYVEDEALDTIEALEAVPDAGELKASQAKEAVKRAEDALAGYAALDDGQKMLVDEALIANAQEVVAKGAELIEQADAKAVGKVKDKAFSVKAGKSKIIYFKTKASAAGTKVVYKKASGSKYISVTKSGKVTAKKGMKKGKTYTAKVKVVCGEATKTVTITVKAK